MAKVKKKSKTKVVKKSQPQQGTSTFPEQGDLTHLLSPEEAQQELDAATRLRYGGQEAAIGTQLGVSDEMQRRITHWYDNYKQEVKGAQQRAGRVYARSAQGYKNFANQGALIDQARQQQLNQEAQRDAQLRGTTVDPRVGQIGAQAAMARRRTSEAMLGNLQGHRAANVTYLSNQRRNVAGQKLLAHEEEAGRKRALYKTQEQLKKEEGDFSLTYRGQLRQNERNYKLALDTLAANTQKAKQQNQIAKAKLKQSALQFNEQQALREAKYRLDVKKYGKASAKDRYQRRHHIGPYASKSKGSKGGRKGGGSGLPSASNNTVISKIQQARARASGYRSAGKSKHLIYQQLRNKYDNDYVNAAMDLLYLGHLSSTNRRRLKARGIHIPKGW